MDSFRQAIRKESDVKDVLVFNRINGAAEVKVETDEELDHDQVVAADDSIPLIHARKANGIYV